MSGKLYHLYRKVQILPVLFFSRKNTVYLFGCPIHPNMGDQAQTYCIQNWLEENYPDHKVIQFDWSTSYLMVLKLLRKKIRPDDRIFFHSGYFLVDHHSELPVYCKVVSLFSNHRIVVLPQTINFFDANVEAQVASIFNAHPDLILMCRDEVSYKKAQTAFSKCKLMLYPDVVTSLIGTKRFDHVRDGVLFCMRNDIEAFYKLEQITALRARFEGICSTTWADTSINVARRSLEINRESILYEMFEQFSQYKVIVTDRYHGTIFSLIAGTPVIVLSSADHKLSSGVKWFSDSFKDYVTFASNLDEAFEKAKVVCEKEMDHILPTYFKDQYYSILKSRLK